MDAMKKFMDQDQAVKLNYASKYSQVANYWKNRQGMIDALTLHKNRKRKQKTKLNLTNGQIKLLTKQITVMSSKQSTDFMLRQTRKLDMTII
jgi:hypothetical protein